MELPESSDGRGITVTIKYGKGYEESWAVFKGSLAEVREDIIAYFELGDTNGLTLSEVVVNATQLAHGKGVVASKLGGTAITEQQAQQGGSDPWAGVGNSQPAKEAPHPLLAQIEAQTSVSDLKRLWAENRSEFDKHAHLMDAYSTKGKALKAQEAQ